MGMIHLMMADHIPRLILILVLLGLLLLGKKHAKAHPVIAGEARIRHNHVNIDPTAEGGSKVCPNCNISYSSSDNYCNRCGEALTEIHSSKYTYKLKRNTGNYGDGFFLLRIEDNQRLSWQTLSVGEGLISLEVAGTSFREDALQDPSFKPGKKVLLVPEPNNEYDPNAIGIWNSEMTRQVGYIPRNHSKRIAKKLNKGERWHALSMWQTVKKGKRVGLRILMYREGTRIIS